MTVKQFEREKKYQAALAVARAMLNSGIISMDDYEKIETNFRANFSPYIGIFLSEKP